MARMAVRRALRQCPGLHRRSAYILGVELPNDIDTKLYEKALEFEFQSMDPDGPGRTTRPEFHYFIDERGKSRYRRKEPFESFSIGMSITEHQRLIGIGTPKHPITDVFRNIAEAVIEVRPTRRHLQAAALIARGFHLNDYIADELIAHNIASLSIAFRGNRPLKAALGMLEALAAAEASITPKRHDDEETPLLEEMSGYGEAKVWGLELARDLKDWGAGALAWSDVDRGVLLLGGPGTGKTVFAKALAKSCGAKFVECSLSKTQALGHLGDMLKGINKAFSEARSDTPAIPAILFLDEFDGVGNRQTLSRHAPEYATQVITGLLELMDGSERRDGVVIVAACNRLETIDRAFLRPGRLERVIEIRPPDHAARKAIFSQHLMSALPEGDLNGIGRLTEGWTGAELERLARDCRRAARRTGKALDTQQVESTISNTFTKVSPKELERFAVHEAGHVVAAYAISGVVATEVVIREYDKTTNGYRVESGGQTTLPVAQSSFQVRSDYLDKIAVLLAGHAAEELFFDEASDGAGLVAGSDLEQATTVAARLVACSGLSSNLVFKANLSGAELKRMVRDDDRFSRDCDLILKTQMRRVREILKSNKLTIHSIAMDLQKLAKLDRHQLSEHLIGKSEIPPSVDSTIIKLART
ncbi:AAA family ATPase [Roseibium aggregatum]|uniref:AAA family ATPase n=1 Tax=Roseibium aggregatum TaxID=187304 RepID=UPI0025AB8421|nr:AAA family ATPase [Roseibium aggregatum]WJS00324.1 AAA family ATPase [Roseibium aggregatum]